MSSTMNVEASYRTFKVRFLKGCLGQQIFIFQLLLNLSRIVDFRNLGRKRSYVETETGFEDDENRFRGVIEGAYRTNFKIQKSLSHETSSRD